MFRFSEGTIHLNFDDHKVNSDHEWADRLYVIDDDVARKEFPQDGSMGEMIQERKLNELIKVDLDTVIVSQNDKWSKDMLKQVSEKEKQY